MSRKRPSRRYIGFRFEPPRATRAEVAQGLASAWKGAGPPEAAPGPRLLVCAHGSGILVVEAPLAHRARAALEASGGELRFEPVVTSGTIATVKERMKIAAGRAP